MNLLNKCYDRFSSSLQFISSERNTENTMSDLYFKKVIILRKIHVAMESFAPPFQFEPEQKKTCDNESHEKETKHIHASAADLLHIRIGNLDWSASEASLHPAFTARVLVTHVSLIHLVDGFLFLILM